MSKLLKVFISITTLIVIIVAIVLYWQYQAIHPSTDDAYVQANVIQIAPQISGQIDHIDTADNQTVKKDQLLFSIDPKPFTYKVEQAQAQLKQTEQDLIAKADAVKTAEAMVTEREAEEVVAQKNYDRIIYLANSDQATKSEADQVTSQLEAAKAALTAAKTEVLKAKAELGAPGNQNADLEVAQENLNAALLNLQYTKIYAPEDGVITNFDLRVGDVVTADEETFSLIEDNVWWVDANYKETDLTHIKVGQKAKIVVDIYPDYTFTGIVDSISDGSGASFSLLPPENATGNWVKVTQRFPVKIIVNNLNSKYPLRVGASATVTIDAQTPRE